MAGHGWASEEVCVCVHAVTAMQGNHCLFITANAGAVDGEAKKMKCDE